MSVKSFQKKVSSKFPEISGTRISIHTHQLITGTGCSSLDAILGGGIPIGSVILIQDDSETVPGGEDPTRYGKVLQKLFLTYGIFNAHAVYFASCDKDGQDFLNNLPDFETSDTQLTSQPSSSTERDTTNDSLRIAWRYKNKKTDLQSKPGTDAFRFNLQKCLPKSKLCQSLCETWTPDFENFKEESNYLPTIFAKLQNLQSEDEFVIKSPSEAKNLRRVCISNLDCKIFTNCENELTRFLLSLRSLMRNSLAVSLISVHSSNLTSKLLNRLHQSVDFVVSLKTFDEKIRKQNLFNENHGFLEVLKATNFGSLSFLRCQGKKYIFKSLKSKFSIEMIHLPPELGDDQDKKEKDPPNIDF